MKITQKALRALIRESLGGSRIVKERPWAVSYSFRLSDGTASDSEGKGPDGFAIVLQGESGTIVRVIIDTYWNPTSGDTSGNSIKVEVNGEVSPEATSYIPTRLDDGKEQLITISNSPVSSLMTISHSMKPTSPAVVYIAISNPFNDEEDINFAIEKMGNGDAEIDIAGQSNF